MLSIKGKDVTSCVSHYYSECPRSLVQLSQYTLQRSISIVYTHYLDIDKTSWTDSLADTPKFLSYALRLPGRLSMNKFILELSICQFSPKASSNKNKGNLVGKSEGSRNITSLPRSKCQIQIMTKLARASQKKCASTIEVVSSLSLTPQEEN